MGRCAREDKSYAYSSNDESNKHNLHSISRDVIDLVMTQPKEVHQDVQYCKDEKNVDDRGHPETKHDASRSDR